MASSFVIYIDEAGDEGFKFKPMGSSSEWFVLSAVIARKNSEPLIWESMKNTKLLLGRLANKPLHFRELSHNKRLAWAQQLLKAPIRSISILVHKPSLTERDTFKIKYQLYRYTCRLLVERCSWLCRDRLKKGVGDGTAEIIFSNRSAMSYDDLRNYLKRLRDDPSQKTSIVWDHINLTKLTAINHDQNPGLQIADCVASATLHAITADEWGNTEPRYFSELLPIAYNRDKVVFNYGVKLFPCLEQIRPSTALTSFFDGLK